LARPLKVFELPAQIVLGVGVGPVSAQVVAESLTPAGVTPAGAASVIDHVGVTVLVVKTWFAVGVLITTVGGTLSATLTLNKRVAVCGLPATSEALTVSV
jgi:hypothetical protein